MCSIKSSIKKYLNICRGVSSPTISSSNFILFKEGHGIVFKFSWDHYIFLKIILLYFYFELINLRNNRLRKNIFWLYFIFIVSYYSGKTLELGN